MKRRSPTSNSRTSSDRSAWPRSRRSARASRSPRRARQGRRRQLRASSAGTPPASASTSSTAPRTPCRPAASSSTRRGTRRATSGTCGSKGFGPGSSTAFASPDRTRRTTGIASIRTSCSWIPTRRRLLPSPDRDSRLRRWLRSVVAPEGPVVLRGRRRGAPRPSASSRTRTSTGRAISRSASRGTSTVIYELHVRGYTIASERAACRLRAPISGLIEKIPYLKDLGRHRRRTDAGAGVQRARARCASTRDRRAAQELLGLRSGRLLRAQGVVRAASASDGAQVLEFKEMVRAFHREGHRGDPRRRLQPHRRRRRARADASRFRGIDNAIYYWLADDKRYYRDFTGTGQTRQREPSGRARSHPRRAALLGDGDARRRLPLRSRLGARPRSSGATSWPTRRCWSASPRTRSSATRSSSPRPGTRRARTRSAASRTAAGRSGTAISGTTSAGSGGETRA